MIGRARRGGRHRDGQPPTTVYRRLWDGPARSDAETLDRSTPGWSVFYSLSQRRFYAIAAWPTPQPLIVSDASAEGLQNQMHQAETTLTWQSLPEQVRRHPAPVPRREMTR
ncbi:hypothetical protein ACFY19_25765 [Streptosporangium saharense]|uniref:hypothetical protein n=1 Tax=Streptosporangium saharense TaxID=1706840 RepID=UPI0036C5A853